MAANTYKVKMHRVVMLIACIAITTLLFGCVPESKYNSLSVQYGVVEEENTKLKFELDEQKRQLFKERASYSELEKDYELEITERDRLQAELDSLQTELNKQLDSLQIELNKQKELNLQKDGRAIEGNTVQGKVSRSDGKSVAGYVVYLFGKWAYMSCGETTVNENGYYKFCNLQPDTYEIYVEGITGMWLLNREADAEVHVSEGSSSIAPNIIIK